MFRIYNPNGTPAASIGLEAAAVTGLPIQIGDYIYVGSIDYISNSDVLIGVYRVNGI